MQEFCDYFNGAKIVWNYGTETACEIFVVCCRLFARKTISACSLSAGIPGEKELLRLIRPSFVIISLYIGTIRSKQLYKFNVPRAILQACRV